MANEPERTTSDGDKKPIGGGSIGLAIGLLIVVGLVLRTCDPATSATQTALPSQPRPPVQAPSSTTTTPAPESMATVVKDVVMAPASNASTCDEAAGWEQINVPDHRSLCSNDTEKVEVCFRNRSGDWNSSPSPREKADAIRVRSRIEAPQSFKFSIIDERDKCPD